MGVPIVAVVFFFGDRFRYKFRWLQINLLLKGGILKDELVPSLPNEPLGVYAHTNLSLVGAQGMGVAIILLRI